MDQPVRNGISMILGLCYADQTTIQLSNAINFRAPKYRHTAACIIIITNVCIQETQRRLIVQILQRRTGLSDKFFYL